AAQPATPPAPTMDPVATSVPEDSASALPAADDGDADIAVRPPTSPAPPSRKPIPAALPTAQLPAGSATVMDESVPQRLARSEERDSAGNGSSSADHRNAAPAGSQSIAGGNARAANAPRSTTTQAAAFAMPVSQAAPSSAVSQGAPDSTAP